MFQVRGMVPSMAIITESFPMKSRRQFANLSFRTILSLGLISRTRFSRTAPQAFIKKLQWENGSLWQIRRPDILEISWPVYFDDPDPISDLKSTQMNVFLCSISRAESACCIPYEFVPWPRDHPVVIRNFQLRLCIGTRQPCPSLITYVPDDDPGEFTLSEFSSYFSCPSPMTRTRLFHGL